MTQLANDIILLVEDNPNDARLVARAFERAGVESAVRHVHDGEEAIAYLAGIGQFGDRNRYPIPAVILLDLGLPKFNGYQLMLWLRTQNEIKRIPVVVLTDSADSESINRAYDAGANSYLVKPGAPEEVTALIERMRSYWTEFNQRPRLVLRGTAAE